MEHGVEPLMRSEVRAVDLVYSPDDGGYYLHDYDLPKGKDRVSKKTWDSRDDAVREFKLCIVEWDE